MNKNIWQEKILIAPSLICCDMCNLEQQIRAIEEAGIPMLHIDIIDGHFSPSMPLGLETVKQLRGITTLPFDVHLMTTNHDYFVDELLNIGVQQLVFHAECEPHIDNRLNMIHEKGVRAGVALKPATPLSTVEFVLEKCDAVLLMLINPGYASNKTEAQVTYAARKIKDLRKRINDNGLECKIEIDGRISYQNIAEFGSEDVDIFVVGSTCLNRYNLHCSATELLQYRKTLLK